MLCGKSKEFIRRLECAPATAAVCTACDDALHKSAPFHDREVWSGTHFIAVAPTTSKIFAWNLHYRVFTHVGATFTSAWKSKYIK